MKRDKIIYWIATGVLSAMMGVSAVMYIISTDEVSEVFSTLGFPTYLVLPLGIAKLLGLVGILTKKSHLLKQLAYAGFFYDFLLAASAHINVRDGDVAPSLVALTLLVVSYIYDGKVFSRKSQQ